MREIIIMLRKVLWVGNASTSKLESSIAFDTWWIQWTDDMHIWNILNYNGIVYRFELLNFAVFQTKTHICLITDYYPGGELFMLLDRQQTKVLKEDAARYVISKYLSKKHSTELAETLISYSHGLLNIYWDIFHFASVDNFFFFFFVSCRFYAAEVVVALEYLHCQGSLYIHM